MKTKAIMLLMASLLGINSVYAQQSVQTINPSVEQKELEIEVWKPYTPIVSDWVDVTQFYGCTNWTPDANSIQNGKVFIQTATDCKKNQRRFVQAREIGSNSQQIKNIGTPTIEENVLTNQNVQRQMIGLSKKECFYNNAMASTMATYFKREHTDMDKFRLKMTWNGSILINSLGLYDENFTARSVDWNGYRFTFGDLVSSDNPPYGYYQVCREPIVQ